MTGMAENVTVPDFAPGLRLGQLEQTGFRDAEPWGRWLLGQRATLSFHSPEDQHAELDLRVYLPYPGQHVALSLNGKTIFSAPRPSDPAGRLAGSFPVTLTAGRNTLEITTDKSNLGGTDPPFAENDRSDISVALSTLELTPLQLRGGEIYGLQPSVFLSPGYTSAGARGLEILFGPGSGRELSYSLLRRSEHQAFDFYLDGRLIQTLDAGLPGHLLTGQFRVPSVPLPPSGLHTLRVSVQASERQPSGPDHTIISTTSKDNPDVRFYVQRLELRSADPQADPLAFLPGIALLTALLVGLLWWWLLGPRRLSSHSQSPGSQSPGSQRR